MSGCVGNIHGHRLCLYTEREPFYRKTTAASFVSTQVLLFMLSLSLSLSLSPLSVSSPPPPTVRWQIPFSDDTVTCSQKQQRKPSAAARQLSRQTTTTAAVLHIKLGAHRHWATTLHHNIRPIWPPRRVICRHPAGTVWRGPTKSHRVVITAGVRTFMVRGRTEQKTSRGLQSAGERKNGHHQIEDRTFYSTLSGLLVSTRLQVRSSPTKTSKK